MSESKSSISYNPGWLGLLGVILCAGKAFGLTPPEITWFWATMPFWIGFAILLAVLAATGGLGIIVVTMGWVSDKITYRKRRKTWKLSRRREKK